MLRVGITLSNEPGLYNPRDGYGLNQSNTVVIAANGAHRMNRTPLTREFRWITNWRSGGGFGTRGPAGRNRSTFSAAYIRGFRGVIVVQVEVLQTDSGDTLACSRGT